MGYRRPVVGQDIQNALGVVDKEPQCMRHNPGVTFSWKFLAKRYAQNDSDIHLHVRVRWINGDFGNYCFSFRKRLPVTSCPQES